MGSQLVKNSPGHQQTSSSSFSSNYQPLRSSPLHKSTRSSHQQQNCPSIPKSIVVVNQGPKQNQKSVVDLKIPEPLIKPLIPFGQSVVIGADQPRLPIKPLVEIGNLFDYNLRLAADTVSLEQQKIIERVRLVEQNSGKISQQYCQEKQRRFNKAAENFGKFDDIRVLLERCETDIEHLLTTFAKLNSALPESLSTSVAVSAAGSATPNLGSISGNSSIREQNPIQSQASSSILGFRQSGQSSNSTTIPMQNAFGNIGSGLGGGKGGPPPPLDMNEFPSLSGTVSINSSTIGRPAYVGMVKDNVPNQSGSNEFNIQSEDFPALPGASPGSSAAVAAAAASFQFSNDTGATNRSDGSNSNNNADHHLHHHQNDNNRSTTTPPMGSSAAASVGASALTSSLFSSLSAANNSSTSASSTSASGTSSNGNGGNGTNKKTSIHVTKDGHITNLPPGMINDQYGIAGLLALLQQADSNPNLLALTIGYDFSSMNINLSSKDRLYPSFPGPFNDRPLKLYEIDYPVPQEYVIFNTIREKLSQIKLSHFGEDLLFFLFYCYAGEHLQAAVGHELFQRDWRYHKDEQIWLYRKQVLEQSSNFERGSYVYFDPKKWSKNQKEMLIEYDRLDGPNQS